MTALSKKWAKLMPKASRLSRLPAIIILTAAAAVLGVWLCTKADKKSLKLLD